MNYQNSIYGSFRNNIFTHVHADDWNQSNNNRWDDVNNFLADWKNTIYYQQYHVAAEGTTPEKNLLSDNTIKLIYTLLYSNYGNSTVASSDENRFKSKVFTIIFQYGPTWNKRLQIQDKLRDLDLDSGDLFAGTKAIYNQALNPQTAPTTDELDYINSQSTTGYKKGKLEAYENLMGLLATDVTEQFTARFKDLFLIVVQPERPLLYENEIEGDEE